jgi:hypothetical protein
MNLPSMYLWSGWYPLANGKWRVQRGCENNLRPDIRNIPIQKKIQANTAKGSMSKTLATTDHVK